ncbi:quinone oxidoreductase family protein [Mycolicibacterium goodii]|uniref:quinone oxidoreductase family protein n=1 Tax=Mycolicibacterium goodii TaxID=134601 RepID=UPI000C25DD4B|nr:quinone oxidoreductase [Mycolicibacterium goodii]PJK18202.1 NADPH:quinone reductase [Mycolicibacterium goodii]
MKAIVINKNGGPEAVELSEHDPALPQDGQLQVTVEVAGVNYLDIYQRNGALQAPFGAGVEGVGVVSQVGPGVNLAVGTRVGWLAGQGSFAESITIDAAKTVTIPDDISSTDAVALLMQGVTAHYLTTAAVQLVAHHTVLVHAAAGGVGRLLVQVAHHIGATVIATASTDAKRAIALDAGADYAIDYEGFADRVREITGGAGVDVVYDGIGKATVAESLDSLAARGNLIVIGAASGPPPAVEFGQLAKGSYGIRRPSVAHYTALPGELQARAAEVFQWARDGVITTSIARRYPLEDVAKAQQDLESRQLAGKLVIDIAGA